MAVTSHVGEPLLSPYWVMWEMVATHGKAAGVAVGCLCGHGKMHGLGEQRQGFDPVVGA